jgi:hypothetical protein
MVQNKFKHISDNFYCCTVHFDNTEIVITNKQNCGAFVGDKNFNISDSF